MIQIMENNLHHVVRRTCWIDDLDTQKFCIEFLSALEEERAILLLESIGPDWTTLPKRRQERKKKKVVTRVLGAEHHNY